MSIVVDLHGSAHARGRQQATCDRDTADKLRAAIALRLDMAPWLARADISAFLAAQHAFTAAEDPEAMAEIAGIAEGFGIAPRRVFDYLHLGVCADLVAITPRAEDGCTAWAARHDAYGAIVAKNRDFRGEHQAIQRVFRHHDGARRMVCVGSLGSPGAYSNGMNDRGLALVDTQIATRDHGVGHLRYFLMTRILRDCSSVGEAIALVRRVTHAGGGSLVLADATGAMATIELGHRHVAVATGERFVAHTNHFVAPELAEAGLPEAASPRGRASTLERLAWLRSSLERQPRPDLDAAERLMAGHPRHEGDEGFFCRHGEDGDSLTISSVVYACGARRLRFAPERPCRGHWMTIDL